MQSTQEYVDMYLCVQEYRKENASMLNTKLGTSKFRDYVMPTSSLPESVDWRTAGAITKVKDQVSYMMVT